MKHPTRNFDVLSDLMKQCRYTYCLDADLDTITLTGVMSCLGWSADEEVRRQRRGEKREIKKLYCHLNTYQPLQRELKLYSSENHMLDDLREDISAGKRCFIVSNKKKFIDGHFESFSKVYSDKKFKKVVSNSGNDEDTRAFLKNIREDILSYDAVWASPSIGTGIDITFPNEETRIDCVYGFFYTGITTHFDIDQQLGRVRHPGEVKVFVMPAKSKFSIDRKRVLQELLNSNMIKGLQYYLDHDGSHYSPGEHPFLELLTEVLVVRRRSMNQLRNNFVSHKEGNGWRVTAIETDVLARDKGSIVNKAGRAEQTRAWFKWVLDAEEIGFEKSYRLQEKKDRNDPLTDREKASLERYWIKKFYQQEVTEVLVEFDEQGKTRERIILLETLLDPTLLYRSFDQWQSNKDLLSSYDPKKYDAKRVAKAVFLREALSIAGIFDLETFSLNLKAVYGTATLGNFVEFMQNHDERLQRLFEKRVNEDISKRPIVQVRALLRLVGLQQEAVFKNRGGQVGVATYRLEPNSYQKLRDIMALRAQSKSKDGERLQETSTAQSGEV